MKTGIRIKSAQYAGDYKLKITFTDGKVNIFDYKSLVTSGHDEFSRYLDITKFKKFKISKLGDEIYWDDDCMLVSLQSLYNKKVVNYKRNFTALAA